MVSKELGEKPLIHGSCQIINSDFGKYCEVGEYNVFENVSLGSYSYTGPWCIIQNTQVGLFSNIAAMVRIGPTDHPMTRPTQHHFTYRRRMFGMSAEDDGDFFNHRRQRVTKIGHDTWIGHGAIILPEIIVGHGSVIGAGAVVTKDVPEYAIVVGNPAKVIRYRFSDDVINGLLSIAWWNWSHQQLIDALDDFCGSAEDFISKYRNDV
ncbi:MAG: chloramphenicol acetyltransferase [Spirochaetaceae bacterium]|nr:MAG: chloramphenicol acetyltransferase [Spirochaetaceae bacterium]